MSGKEKRETLESLAKKIAKRSGTTEARSRKFVEALFDEVSLGLEKEEKVQLSGFGIFKKRFVKKREGYNPQKQKKMKIKAHNKVSFTPSRSLADEVNRKYRHLKPNVIDEMRAITGLSREKEAPLTPTRKKARKRAIITLGVLAALLVLFFSSLLLIPALFRKSDSEAVRFIRHLNAMMGLEELSDRLADNLPERINEKMLGEYIFRAGRELGRNRKVIHRHTVRVGDTIYNIAKRYYGNRYLWPDLYYLNKNKFEDPDLLRDGDTILVYEKLGDPSHLTPSQKKQLVQAYITMYRVSRALGEREIERGFKTKGRERIRESRWTLYSALRYEHDLLDIYEDAIYPEDAKTVDDFVDRFGYGDGTTRSFWDIF